MLVITIAKQNYELPNYPVAWLAVGIPERVMLAPGKIINTEFSIAAFDDTGGSHFRRSFKIEDFPWVSPKQSSAVLMAWQCDIVVQPATIEAYPPGTSAQNRKPQLGMRISPTDRLLYAWFLDAIRSPWVARTMALLNQWLVVVDLVIWMLQTSVSSWDRVPCSKDLFHQGKTRGLRPSSQPLWCCFEINDGWNMSDGLKMS